MKKDINVRIIIAAGLILAFLANSFGPIPTAQAQEFILPQPGVMIHLSPAFNPPILKGIKVHPDNPFSFDFILDQGDSPSLVQRGGQGELKQESTKLIKYFLASLTIPEKDLWVNLSPYEKDRIIPSSFGLTQMGRDLLAEDYMLKQITASLMYPEEDTGKKFWKRVYQETALKYGRTDIAINTFNKVWIVPEKAVVYENAKAGTAYIVEAKLKVMLEQDYLALANEALKGQATQSNDVNALGSSIIREIVIPELTKEVNENKNFAQLRQVYNSLILAAWYKKKIKDSILLYVYGDQNKVAGISIADPNERQRIYERYLESFKKGTYDLIKEEEDPLTQKIIPRKYFSGGLNLDIDRAMNVSDGSGIVPQQGDSSYDVVQATIQSLNQKEAGELAQQFFVDLARQSRLKQAVIQGEIPLRNVLVVLRHLFIELSFLDQDTHLTGEKYTPRRFLPLSREVLNEGANQRLLSNIALRRLKPGGARPDVFSHEHMLKVFSGKTVLVTGGSGYISAAIIQALLAVGAQVIVYTRNPHDLKEIGQQEGVVVVKGQLVKKDLENAMKKYKVDGVIHLAAEILIPKSHRQPGKFFDTNNLGTMELVSAMHAADVHNIVFASSTMVYSGEEFNKEGLLEEDMMPNPKNAYGATKYINELFLKEMRDFGIHSVILRTFNVAGAFFWLGRWYGERDSSANHLIPRLIKSYLYPKQVSFSIMGNKYPTRDHTAVRDFVHPQDVAEAYVRSLAHLFDEGDDLILNVGTRHGASVKTIVRIFKRVVKESRASMDLPNNPINPKITPARFGDPADLRADTIRMSLELGGWRPRKSIWDIMKMDLAYHLGQGEKASLGMARPPVPDDSLPEWAYMKKIHERLLAKGDPVISDKLKFEILFLLLVYTLNPDFPREDYSKEIINNVKITKKQIETITKTEIELYKKAMTIQASPEGLINAINDEFEEKREESFRKSLEEYQRLISMLEGDIFQQRGLYINTLLRLLSSLPTRPPLHFMISHLMMRHLPTQEQESRIIKLLTYKEEFDEKSLIELAKIAGLSERTFPFYLQHLGRLERLKPDPVNKPENWDLFIPVYEHRTDSKARVIKRYWAATRDRDWYGVSSGYVFNKKGELYCRVQQNGDLDMTVEGIVEVGLNHDSTAVNDILGELKLPVADHLLRRLPHTHYYDFDPRNETERIEKGVYYGKSKQKDWVGQAKVIEKSYEVVLTEEQEIAWNRDYKSITSRFIRVKPQDLIDRYNKAEGLSESLRAAMNYPDFRQWLLKKNDLAQLVTLPKNGGIDLRSSFKNLHVQYQGVTAIHFKIDPLELQQLREASGFVPVITGILPIPSLRVFLGISTPAGK